MRHFLFLLILAIILVATSCDNGREYTFSKVTITDGEHSNTVQCKKPHTFRLQGNRLVDITATAEDPRLDTIIYNSRRNQVIKYYDNRRIKLVYSL